MRIRGREKIGCVGRFAAKDGMVGGLPVGDFRVITRAPIVGRFAFAHHRTSNAANGGGR